MRPCWPSHSSLCASSASIECEANRSGVARSFVASSATAFAPLSQNSALARCPGSGSGQAQLMQSKPSAWLSRRRVFAVRAGPMRSSERFIVTATAVGPAA
jgi:hypothetical protein